MRVFVTGASGHIGSAVVPELIAAGHQVTGLARSDSSAAVCSAAGAAVLPGTIDDLDLLRSAAPCMSPERIASCLNARWMTPSA